MKGCTPLTEAEYHALFAELRCQRDRALFVLGCNTGFRISELLSMRRGDVWSGDGPRSHVAVRRANMKGSKAGRSIPLNRTAQRALRDYLGKDLEGEIQPTATTHPLFMSNHPEGRAISITQAYRILTAAASRAGITKKIATHTMRKTFARRVYDRAGCDLVVTREALGHTNLQSTERYLAPETGEVEAAILEI